ncbi:MAG: hypothetical protein C4586_05950, partial [Anaerolineaceae bacterium]
MNNLKKNYFFWILMVLVLAGAVSGRTIDFLRFRPTTLPSTGKAGEVRLESSSQTIKKWNSSSSSWDAIAGISGVVGIANGGTNNGSLGVTAGGVIYTDGSKLMNVGVGTNGYVLMSQGSSVPVWTSQNVTAPGINILKDYNYNAETGDTGSWSESGGGTLASTSTGANVGNGFYAISYDASANADYLATGLAPIPAGLYGANCLAEFLYKGFDSNITAQVHDNTNVIASQALSASTGYTKTQINFPCPSSGSLQVRWLASADAAIGYIDEVHLGSATNLFDYSGAIDYGTETWTDNWTNTTTSVEITRIGDMVFLAGTATITGTPVVTGTGYEVTIPAQYAPADTAAVQTQNTAKIVSAGGTFTGAAGVESSTIIEVRALNIPTTYLLPTALSATVPGSFTTGDSIKWWTQYKVSGWTTTPAAALSNSAPGAWSGYHDNTCSWARTNTSYGDPATDASCALTERTNMNFGTVSDSGDLPNILFTPNSTGRYYVCAHVSVTIATDTAGGELRLWDGTTTIAESGTWASSTNSGHRISLCGVYVATSASSKTLSVQSKASSGAITINGSASAGGTAIEW